MARRSSIRLKILSNHIDVFRLMEKCGYIRQFKIVKSTQGSKHILVDVVLGYLSKDKLLKQIISYEHSPFKFCGYIELKKLSEHNQGIFIISTVSHGICTNEIALSNKIGGVLLAYLS